MAQPANPAYEKALANRLLTARHAAGITQKQAATAIEVAEITLRGWEQGRHIPKLWRIPRIAEAYGCCMASLLVEPNGSTPVTEVWVSDQTLSEIRKGGRGASVEVAERLARALEPLLYQAAMGASRKPDPTQRRAKPRRTREQVLAGITAATEQRAAAKQRYAAEQQGQPGGGDELTAQ